ncbi:MAG TPA: ZIP family metal transporter [Mycobacteriales bacterium]|nr:ZIP family metal transporter [Mycobacteriales bacterium]
MSSTRIVILGALAGGTIFVGLPVGRMRRPAPRLRQFLNASAIGVLVFLLIDIGSHALAPLDARLTVIRSGRGSIPDLIGLATLLVLGLGIGLLSLVYYEAWMRRRRRRFGPGAAAVEEFEASSRTLADTAMRTALLIAIGIGLHNFSEGLAIGQAAVTGEVSLAVLLVIGFGLHNATEGFGIVGPFAGGSVRPSWGRLTALGLIGGGPTFVGTVLGQAVHSDALSVAFLALAAGSILYVIVQLVGVALRSGSRQALYWGLLVGLVAGIATDLVVTAAGG